MNHDSTSGTDAYGLLNGINAASTASVIAEPTLKAGNSGDSADAAHSGGILEPMTFDDVAEIDATKKWTIINPTLPLGSGGFARVWGCMRSTDNLPKGVWQRIDLSAVIKILRYPTATDDYAMRRFSAEAKALAQLAGSGVTPRLLDFDSTQSNRPYLVIEKVAGVTLAAEMRKYESKPSRDGFLTLFESICTSVLQIHERGWTHRDLSWNNVMVDENGKVSLIDLGLSDRLDGTLDEKLRLQDAVRSFGTPYLGAPEQCVSREKGKSREVVDVYSIGALLYWALFNKTFGEPNSKPRIDVPPFGKQNNPPAAENFVRPVDAFDQLSNAGKIACAERLQMTPARFRAALNGALGRILTRAVSWKPAERFQSVEELRQALAQFRTARSRRLKWAIEAAGVAMILSAACATSLAAQHHLRHDSDMSAQSVALAHQAADQNIHVETLARQLDRKADLASQYNAVLNDLITHAPADMKFDRRVPVLKSMAADVEKNNAFSNDPHNRVQLLQRIGEGLLNVGGTDEAEHVFRSALNMADAAQLTADEQGELLSLTARSIRDAYNPYRVTEAIEFYRKSAESFAKSDPPNQQQVDFQNNELRLLSGKAHDSAPYISYIAIARGKKGQESAVYEEIRKAVEQAGEQARNGEMQAGIQTIIDLVKPYDESFLTHRFLPTALLNVPEIGAEHYPDAHEPIMLAAVELEKKLNPEPVLENAYVDGRVGSFYKERGDYAKAEPFLKSAIELGHRLLDTPNPNHPELLARELDYAIVLWKTANGNPTRMGEAVSHATVAQDRMKASESFQLTESQVLLANIEADAGHAQEARQWLARARETFKADENKMADNYKSDIAGRIEAAARAIDP